MICLFLLSFLVNLSVLKCSWPKFITPHLCVNLTLNINNSTGPAVGKSQLLWLRLHSRPGGHFLQLTFYKEQAY